MKYWDRIEITKDAWNNLGLNDQYILYLNGTSTTISLKVSEDGYSYLAHVHILNKVCNTVSTKTIFARTLDLAKDRAIEYALSVIHDKIEILNHDIDIISNFAKI